jgi:hypothetical protein
MLILSPKSPRPLDSSLKRFSWVAALLLSLGGAGFCEAENTLVVTQQSLATGDNLYSPEVTPVQASSACSKESTNLQAPQYLIVPTISLSRRGGEISYTLVYYQFVFWNINGTPHSSQNVKFLPDCGQQNFAAAWYRVICDPNPAGCTDCIGGGTDASVSAFSLTDNKPIVGETPIESVTGASWTGPPSTTVTLPSGGATATVDLVSGIAGYGSFVEYQVNGGPIEGGRDQPLKVGDYGIAFYALKNVILPCPPGDRCH